MNTDDIYVNENNLTEIILKINQFSDLYIFVGSMQIVFYIFLKCLHLFLDMKKKKKI